MRSEQNISSVPLFCREDRRAWERCSGNIWQVVAASVLRILLRQ